MSTTGNTQPGGARDAPRPGLLVSQDLIMTSKVTGTALALGLRVELAGQAAAALAMIRSADIQCVIIDLSMNFSQGELEKFVAQAHSAGVATVIAFGSHVAHERLRAARAAGCAEVFHRSQFSSELPGILGRHIAGEAK